MSCLDVMYHQSYGAHYLPAAAYKPTYYNHQQQQRKLSVYSKMQECMEQQHLSGGREMLYKEQGLQGPRSESVSRSSSVSELKDSPQPTKTEYLSPNCVIHSYFEGKSDDVINAHFSRALHLSDTFDSETKPIRVTQSPASAAAGLWKDAVSLSESQSSSAWNNACPSQASSCVPSVPVHPDFSPSPVPFNHPDGALWAGHVFSQTSLPAPASLPETWPYSLNPQSSTNYPNVHDVYLPHPHIHTRHHHPMLHTAHTSGLNSRFSPLLLPGLRNQSQLSASSSNNTSPHSEAVKTEMDASSTTTSVSWSPSSLHGSLEVYDSALDQTKAKTSMWF